MPTIPLLVNQFSILFKSALPVFGTHLLEYALLITSVLAVGHLGKLELAACTLGSMTANVTSFSIVIGMGGALDTVLPGVWGASAGDTKIVDSRLFGLWCQRMAVLYLFLLVPMLCIWLNAEGILALLRQDKEVARLAGRYLTMLAFGLPAFSFNTIAKRYFQAQGLFSVPTKIGTIVAGVNVLLTGILVYYPHPLPRSLAPYLHLGFDGAPLATSISYNLVALGSAFWGWRIEEEMRSAWHPLSMRALHPTGLGTLLTLGLGGVGQTASEWWAWELIGLAASLLGPTALAAQSVLLVSCSTTYQVPFALGIATSVRIGQLLGLARPRLAKLAAHAAIFLGLALSLVFSTVFWIWRKKWAYLFNDDEDVAQIVASILPLVALFQVFDGNAAITGGILRARGKQGTGALLNLSAYYVLGVPLGVYLAFKDIATAGLRGLWIGLTVSLVYCAVLGTILCVTTDWEHEVEKVIARVRAEERRDHQGNRACYVFFDSG
ncbi:mate-domain-containing protein [Lentinula aciculospora]|uniref:Mate-domain-containing protein n=1 Tax=Lentinula aciculospora TaxID=153920 RepID=A0A9W9A8Y2_9AGAR|nr:mate-domain-containing protein [Lentinula aciculospora]